MKPSSGNAGGAARQSLVRLFEGGETPLRTVRPPEAGVFTLAMLFAVTLDATTKRRRACQQIVNAVIKRRHVPHLTR